jgi:hypothetical protein
LILWEGEAVAAEFSPTMAGEELFEFFVAFGTYVFWGRIFSFKAPTTSI